MVCIRCQMVVKYELGRLGIEYTSVKIGEAEVVGDVEPILLEQLNNELKQSGLTLIDNKKAILVEKIKNTIVQLVHFTEEELQVNLSDYLSEKLDYNYTYLANVFSEEKGTTIEKFYISHKIERVKELIIDDELNLSEIAWKMHYSSVAHLSNQFKKFTGLTPTQFKLLKVNHRITLENA